jgi:hypothetical protein
MSGALFMVLMSDSICTRHRSQALKDKKHMTKREMIIAFIKDMLRPRTLEEIIAKEMREAYLSKMDAEKALEYATSVVDYNRQRIRRLEERLKEMK